VCARLAARLLANGDGVFLHLDAKCDDSFRATFEQELGPASAQIHWVDRVAVEWGGWSMIEATLSGLRAIRQAQERSRFDIVYLLSGADYPTRSIESLRGFLARHPDRDFIESKPADSVPWVAGGFQRERYEYRHWLSWRKHPRLFSLNAQVQKRLGLKRRLPEGLVPHIGSQWWVLRWSTCERVLEATESNPALVRFFRTTVVPDELFFQTLVASWLPREKVEDRHLTLYEFTEEGVPVVYHDGHEDTLVKQPFFFARKLSPRAAGLRDALDRNLESGPSNPAGDLQDARVGERSSDYADFVRQHRIGLWGQRCWGRPGISALGELERLKAPYFVVLGPGPARLSPVRGALADRDDWLVHGELFDREAPVALEPSIAAATGYPPDAHAIRDQDRPGFLADIIRCSTEKARYTGWMLRLARPWEAPASDETWALLRLLATDPNCQFLHVAPHAAHRRLLQRLDRECPTHLGMQRRAGWVRVHPRRRQHTGDAWFAALKTALDERRGVCERRFHALQRPGPPPRLTLHIGIHRTGTTAVQKALHDARSDLAARGVHYAFETVNHNFVASCVQQGERTAKSVVQQLIEEGLDSGQPHVLVSAENLAGLRDPVALWDLQRHFDVRVLAYLRRQDHWLESWYNQAIRWPWNAELSRLDPDAFYRRVRRFHWLDYRALHQRWSAVFGSEKVQFRWFENARSGLLQDFVEAAGLPEGVLQPKSLEVNASASPRMTEALRHLDLVSRPDGERSRLIMAVRSAFDGASWPSPRYAFSPAQRRRLLERHRRSNNWVAREILDQPPTRFQEDLPGWDRTLPDLSLPSREDLLRALGSAFLAPWLNALPKAAEHTELPDDQEQRLLDLLQEADRRKRGGYAAPDAGASGGSQERKRELHRALGVGSLAGPERDFADRVLSNWSLRSDVPDQLPPTPEGLLAQWFGPLSSECEALLAIGLTAQHVDRNRVEDRLRSLEQSIGLAPVQSRSRENTPR
jgi:hypothetical protein